MIVLRDTLQLQICPIKLSWLELYATIQGKGGAAVTAWSSVSAFYNICTSSQSLAWLAVQEVGPTELISRILSNFDAVSKTF